MEFVKNIHLIIRSENTSSFFCEMIRQGKAGSGDEKSVFPKLCVSYEFNIITFIFQLWLKKSS